MEEHPAGILLMNVLCWVLLILLEKRHEKERNLDDRGKQQPYEPTFHPRGDLLDGRV
jgi:hypothetical protein